MHRVRGGRVLFLVGAFAAISSAQPIPQQNSQPTQDSLVAASRHAKEMKKEQAKPEPKVWNNDNLPVQGAVSIVGVEPSASPAADDKSKSATPGAASDASASKSADAKSADAGKSDKGDTALKEQLTQAREHLADLEKDYDLAQRQLDLDGKQMSQEPTFLDDRAAQDKLKSESDDVKAKQQDVEDARKAVQDLEAQLKSEN